MNDTNQKQLGKDYPKLKLDESGVPLRVRVETRAKSEKQTLRIDLR